MNEMYQKGSPNGLPRVSVPIFPGCEPVDRLFAVVYLLAGYGFIYLCSSDYFLYGPEFERNLGIFTVFYAVVVLAYLWGKEIRPPKESWFWLAVMLAVGVSYAFWSALYILQFLALLAIAAYWTLSASGRLLKGGQTSRWIFFDGCNALAVVPFGNFGCQVRTLFYESDAGERGEQKKTSGKAGSVLLGIVIVLPALAIILPLLSSADAGFRSLMGGLTDYISDHLLVIVVRMLFAVPVSFYLFGLIFGGIHGRNTERFQEEKLLETAGQLRRVPDTAICTALLIVCLVYGLFMVIQGNYLFSAFIGRIPEGFTYSEYARRGFFELCQIGVWNLIFTWLAGACSRTDRREHKGLGFLTVLLSVLTLLLLVTAVSKMGMYISVYGLTVYRILTLIFMLWMGLVFTCIIIHQKREFPIVRFCVMAGAVMFCLMCVFPIEHWTGQCAPGSCIICVQRLGN